MFKDDIDVREVVKPSVSEFRNRWYTQGEYFVIKKQAMNTVRRMATTTLQDDDRICTRGLEIVDDEAVKRRKLHINSTVQRVLQEQEDQRTGKDVDPEEIAEIYREITIPAVQKSIQTAHDDAQDVERNNNHNHSISNNRTSFGKAVRCVLFINKLFKSRKRWSFASRASRHETQDTGSNIC